jgi:hypothetical protein
VTMQLFIRGYYTMIAAPVQCDVDGIPKRSHYGRVPPMGEASKVSPLQGWQPLAYWLVWRAAVLPGTLPGIQRRIQRQPMMSAAFDSSADFFRVAARIRTRKAGVAKGRYEMGFSSCSCSKSRP